MKNCYLKDGYAAAKTQLEESGKELGMCIGTYSNIRAYLHLVDGNLAVSFDGDRIFTLYPDDSAELTLARFDYLAVGITELLSELLAAPQTTEYLSFKRSVLKKGRVYDLVVYKGGILLKTIRFDSGLKIQNIRDSATAVEPVNQEVVENKDARKAWFKKIGPIRKAAKCAVRISPFKTSQRKVLGLPQYAYYDKTKLGDLVQLIETNNIALIAKYAVANQEGYWNYRDDKSLPPESQVKAVHTLFDRLTREFHKSNIAVKEA